jgi:hypothetical protein
VRLETRPGDRDVAGSGDAERADLVLTPEATGCVPGRQQWWAHSVLFPDDYVAVSPTSRNPWPWSVVFDFHHTGGAGQANFQVEIVDSPPTLRFALSAGPVVSTGAPGSPTRRWPIGPLVRNHWYSFIYHVRWAADDSGLLEAWVDEKQIVAYRGPTLYVGQNCYLKLANYHTATGQAVSVLHALAARADTSEALAAAFRDPRLPIR